jgi:hypothetical protein
MSAFLKLEASESATSLGECVLQTNVAAAAAVVAVLLPCHQLFVT